MFNEMGNKNEAQFYYMYLSLNAYRLHGAHGYSVCVCVCVRCVVCVQYETIWLCNKMVEHN